MTEETGRTVLRVICTPEHAELVADRLLQCGSSAVAESEPAGPEAAVVDPAPAGEGAPGGHGPSGSVALMGDVPTDRLPGLRAWLDSLSPAATVEFPEVDPGWADAWREHARAVVAGPFLVRPPWVEVDSPLSDPVGPDPVGSDRYPRFPIELVIDPGRVFGSGSHPSTRMCLEAVADLGDRFQGPWTVADVGCGSGVLAVGALLLGADMAVGVDIDPAAGAVSRAVAQSNGVGDRYRFREGGIEALRAQNAVFDVVFANLLIPVIEELAATLAAVCVAGGVIVASGLLVEHRPRALAALADSDRPGPTEVVAEYERDGWLTLVVGGGDPVRRVARGKGAAGLG